MSDPQWIPLFLLAAILGLPALLILFTARHPIYILWFLIYLLALPVWNFVLPVYAYWHMDDFSWGETRKVDGPGKEDHGKTEGTFDASHIFMKRWHEFELERVTKADRLVNKSTRRIGSGISGLDSGTESEMGGMNGGDEEDDAEDN